MKNPALEAVSATFEKGEEGALRPLSLSEFIGQKPLCENLKVFITAAR